MILGKGKEMVDRLSNLVAIFQNESLDFSKNKAEGDDILGDAYEYLMRHFATESGKSKGQFYTPAEVSIILALIQKRVKEIKNDADASEEMKVLEGYLKLIEKEADANKKIKDAQTALDKKVIARYKALTGDEVKTLVVDDNWMAAISLDVKTELERISQRLTQRIKELAERKWGLFFDMKKNDMKIDDSVKVKNGILCPDLKDLCIGGWQGRISEIIEDDDGNIIVRIEWDSITLKNMPDYYIDQSDEEDRDYSAMYLGADEVELTQSRDKKEDVAEMIETISKALRWGWLGEEGKRIQKVLFYVNEDDEMEALEAWEKYLEKTLSFPFDAIITGGPDKGPLRTGDKVSVKRISLVEEFHGIIVELRRGHNKYDHPLCDMEVINRESSNYQPVNDYCIWYGNH